METTSDNTTFAFEIIQGIIKAKKQLKLYPPNNPIYVRAFEDVYKKFQNLFLLTDSLTLQILHNEIRVDGSKIYENLQKEDNLALFFFKDGIRELSFHKGLSHKELEQFIHITNTDFENVALDDDIVTLLWEEDFEHVKYVVDDTALFDEQVQEGSRVYEKIKDGSCAEESIIKAYREGLREGGEQSFKFTPLTESDLQYIAKEIAKDELQPLIDKVIFIVLELLYQSKRHSQFMEVVAFIEQIIFYCIRGGDFKKANSVIHAIKSTMQEGGLEKDYLDMLKRVFTTVNSRPFIREIGKVIDGVPEIDRDELMIFVQSLDKTSIPLFIQLLFDLQSIKGRRLVIDIMSIVGILDVDAVAKGLDSSEWYVVRNVIIVLGRIADWRALEHLKKPLSHPDIRVRKEAIKALGEMRNRNILPYIKQALDDKETSVRSIAVKVLGNIQTETAKKLLLDEMSKKDFFYREFEEKKRFFEVLTNWRDNEVRDFLLSSLKKRSLWKKIKYEETRACAAHALGIFGAQDTLPLLEKAQNTKNKLLKSCAQEAIKRMTK